MAIEELARSIQFNRASGVSCAFNSIMDEGVQATDASRVRHQRSLTPKTHLRGSHLMFFGLDCRKSIDCSPGIRHCCPARMLTLLSMVLLLLLLLLLLSKPWRRSWGNLCIESRYQRKLFPYDSNRIMPSGRARTLIWPVGMTLGICETFPLACC